MSQMVLSYFLTSKQVSGYFENLRVMGLVCWFYKRIRFLSLTSLQKHDK